MVAETAVIVAGAVLSAALLGVTWTRTRTPQQRRDLWLSANAQPILSVLSNAVLLVILAVTGWASVLIATFRYPFMWAVAILCASGATSIAMIVLRTAQGRHHGNPRENSVGSGATVAFDDPAASPDRSNA